MDHLPDYQEDLASIRHAMERSVKFISLSGVSGILSGIYALAGAGAALVVTRPDDTTTLKGTIIQLCTIAALVLIASLITGIAFSARKARKLGTTIWNTASRQLFINLLIPLLAGGAFILILLSNGYYILVAPACLLFYGLALVNAGANLHEEMRYLGYSEIILGLVAALLPGYGLLFWAIGFGVFHIFYGALLYRKYDR